jgi:hypothetical protein
LLNVAPLPAETMRLFWFADSETLPHSLRTCCIVRKRRQ